MSQRTVASAANPLPDLGRFLVHLLIMFNVDHVFAVSEQEHFLNIYFPAGNCIAVCGGVIVTVFS